MINLRVKTLDSIDHPFEMDDEATVYDLKEKIKAVMGIEPTQQRLIFCGRVLQDNMRLSECGVDGKVLHMVQKAPPSVAAREAIQEARQGENENVAFNQATYNSNPMIAPVHVQHITPQQIRRFMTMATQGAETEDQVGLNLSPTSSRLTSLRNMINEIRELIETIRDNESNEPPNYPTQDPPQPSGGIAEAMRSGVNADVIYESSHTPLVFQIEPASGSTRQSRGRCIRAMRPTYATHPTVFAALLRQLHELDADFAPFRLMYITTLREASNPLIQLSERTLQRRQITAELSATVLHSFGHAYHLASEVGIVLTHGQPRLMSEAIMRNAAPPQAQVSVFHRSVTRRPRDSGASTSGQSSSAGQAQPSARQADVENLLRGLSQPGAIGGVEVVMSMEEMFPNAGGVPVTPQVIDAAALQQLIGSQIFLAQMPWGGQPTADFLQNIVSSVIQSGQEIVPAVDSVMTEENPNQNQDATSQTEDQANQSTAGPTPDQTQDQTSCDQDIPSSSESELSDLTDTSESQESQSQAEPTQAQENVASGDQPTQQSSGGGQASSGTSRPNNEAISMKNLIYDRFMSCDSVHARRQLERRREETARNGGLFVFDNNISRARHLVETLFERFNQEVINEETLVIAGLLWLYESTAFTRGRVLTPNELFVLRRRLQTYMREIMERDFELNTHRELIDLLFERFSGFIRRMPLITPLRPSIDVVESMRNVIERFLNESMMVLFTDNYEQCLSRFRIVFPRMFYELCGVISYFCYEGVEGLRRIYRTFIADLIQYIDEPVRNLLYSLAMEVLLAPIIRIHTNKLHSAQYLVKRENVPSCSAQASTSQDANVMDTFDTDTQYSQPMEISPLSITDSADEEEFKLHTSTVSQDQEMTGIQGAALILPSASTGPIVPTFTTIPNAPSYQTSTIVQSGPIVPTAPIIPSAPIASTLPSVPVNPIVPTISIVPGSIIADATQVHNAAASGSPTSVIVPTPMAVADLGPASEPAAVSTAPDSPVILSPYSPLSPAGDDNARFTFTTGEESTTYEMGGLLEFVEQGNHDFPSNVTMAAVHPVCVVFFGESDAFDNSNNRNNSPGNRAPRPEAAPASAQSSGSSHARRQSTTSATTSTSATRDTGAPTGRTSSPACSKHHCSLHGEVNMDNSSAPSSSSRPGSSQGSRPSAPMTKKAPVSAQTSGSGQMRRQSIITSVSASTSRATHDFEPRMGRDNSSAPSTSSRPGPSQGSRPSETSTSTYQRSQDLAGSYGSRGRRLHRGTYASSASTSPYNRSQDGYRSRRAQRGYNAPSSSSLTYEGRSQDQLGQRGRPAQRSSQATSTITSAQAQITHHTYPGARGSQRVYIPPTLSARHPVLEHYNVPRPVSYPGQHRRGFLGRDIYLNGYNLGLGHRQSHSNPMANSLAARAERHMLIGSYRNISFDDQNRPAQPDNGAVRQSPDRDQPRPNQEQENNPDSPASPADESNDLRFVLPAQIAQHFGEDWVPTFTRDIQQQNTHHTQEPHSDAYLSGMPPKKRRCVRQARPPATLDGLIRESLSRVAPQVTLEAELLMAFMRQVRVLIKARASASEEYDPRRYVAIERFLSEGRSNTQTLKKIPSP